MATAKPLVARTAPSPAEKSRARPAMDPVTFQVIRNALLNLTEEMAVTVRRAAFSTNIKTRADFSCAFFDTKLRCIAQSFSQPPHLVSMSTITPASVREFGPENIRPGDALIVNDPHRGSSHLNDITIISPVAGGSSRTVGRSTLPMPIRRRFTNWVGSRSLAKP